MAELTATIDVDPAPVPWYVEWMSRGLLPDPLIRWGIRRRLARRLTQEQAGSIEERHARFEALLDGLRASRIAIHTDAANRQHYEVPAEFYRLVLGSHLKYSSALWEEDTPNLDAAEARMLETYCFRADLKDGQTVLDLGCGWGSFSLYAAKRHPRSSFLAVSNSAGQRRFIEQRAAELGITNLRVVTCDVNDLSLDERFDRIVSVEMFEHMRNYRELLGKISGWLRPDGRLFVHIFTHRETAYLFEHEGKDEWMARNFFTGGIMPSDSLLLYFQEHLEIRKHWRVGGTHYERTANAWLARMDRNREEIEGIFARVYGAENVRVWWANWRLFFLACAELWGYRGGHEWMVSHYLFAPRP